MINITEWMKIRGLKAIRNASVAEGPECLARRHCSDQTVTLQLVPEVTDDHQGDRMQRLQSKGHHFALRSKPTCFCGCRNFQTSHFSVMCEYLHLEQKRQAHSAHVHTRVHTYTHYTQLTTRCNMDLDEITHPEGHLWS